MSRKDNEGRKHSHALYFFSRCHVVSPGEAQALFLIPFCPVLGLARRPTFRSRRVENRESRGTGAHSSQPPGQIDNLIVPIRPFFYSFTQHAHQTRTYPPRYSLDETGFGCSGAISIDRRRPPHHFGTRFSPIFQRPQCSP